jgi:TPR repeat protein
MRYYAELFRATLVLAPLAGIAVAGPLEDSRTAYDRGDYASALRLVRALADQGNAVAQFILGVMYDNGKGVLQDNAEAMKCAAGARVGEQQWEGRGIMRAVYPRLFLITHEEIVGLLSARTTGFRVAASANDVLARVGRPNPFLAAGHRD